MVQDDTPIDHVDVLIIGAGPAGLMMANWMSRWGVKTRIVDKRGTKVSYYDRLEAPSLTLTGTTDLQWPSRWPSMPYSRNLRLFRLRTSSMA